jgi:hypothetical protein
MNFITQTCSRDFNWFIIRLFSARFRQF